MGLLTLKQQTVPASPVSGKSTAYFDSADGGRSKVKHSDGTVSSVPVLMTHAARLAASPGVGTLVKESNTGLVYLGNGTSWDVFTAGGVIKKTADETVNNSNTLQNDNELLLPVEANEEWFVEAYLRGAGASINADWLFGFTGPASMTAEWGPVIGAAAVTGGLLGVPPATTPTTMRTIAGTVALGGASGTIGLILAGWFTNSATAGNIQLQWAQNTATVEDNTIKARSFLRVTRLA